MFGYVGKLLYFCGVKEVAYTNEDNFDITEKKCSNACVYENNFVPLHYNNKQINNIES